MIIVGVAFLLFAALLQFTTLSIIGAAFLVGTGLIVLALLTGESLPTIRR